MRIVSGPALRCQESVGPLAAAHRLPVEVDERLGSGEPVERALELLTAGDEGPVLFCTHADVIARILEVFELAGADGGELPYSKKGSLWVLEGEGATPTRATYLEPERATKRRRRLSVREVSRPRSVRAAVLDLGSTSFALLIADVTRHGEVRPVVREKVMLKLGAVIAKDGRIPKDVAKRAVETARELQAVAKREKAQAILPVATAALRDAANGAKVGEQIGKALGAPIRVLSGEEEAHLMFRAFQQRLALASDPVLGLDLGGGSLELAVGCGASVRTEASLKLGTARLHGELVKSDPIGADEAERVRERVREALAPRRQEFLDYRVSEAVAAGGTARALARLVNEREPGAPLREGPLRLSRADLEALCEVFLASTHDERLAMRGMRKRRADVLPTGALILLALAEELQIDGITVCDWGLREGVLLDAVCPPR